MNLHFTFGWKRFSYFLKEFASYLLPATLYSNVGCCIPPRNGKLDFTRRANFGRRKNRVVQTVINFGG